MNPKMLMLAVGALVIIASSAFLLTKNSTNEVPETSPTPTSAVMMDETFEASPSVTTTVIKDDEDDESSEMTGKKAVKEFTVIGSSFKFAPATMTVKKGDVVTIIFKNSGGMHDFVIDELGVKTKVIASGAEETVQGSL